MSEPAPINPSDVPSAAKGKSVFFTGATGYIGGTVLTKLLSLPTPPSSITVLVRDPKKAELFKELSTPSGSTITPLVGSLDDHDQLAAATAEADIVVSTANADNLGSVKAMLEGMKRRREKTGHRPLFIHTSGTGVLVDDAKGQYPNDRIFTDYNPTPASSKSPALLSFETLDPKAPHREVDLAILEADAVGVCKSYIILPSTIWGPGKGEVYDKGISNSFSDQIPTLIRAGLDRKQAGHVGKGANIWPHVSISDTGDLYAHVYNGALKGDIGHGKSGFYLGIAGEYTLLSAAQAIGGALVDNKWAESAQPTTFTKEELGKYYSGSDYMGTNSRGRASRSSSIGWKPKYTEQEDFVRHIKEEVVRVEKHFGREWSKGTK